MTDSRLRSSLISQVGAGFNWQVLFDEELTSFSTSSDVTVFHSVKTLLAVPAPSFGGVVEVAQRIESTLSEKNLANSSVVQSLSSHRPPGFSPKMADIVCHSFSEFPLFSAIFFRQ